MSYRTGQKWKIEYSKGIIYTATIIDNDFDDITIKDRENDIIILKKSLIQRSILLEDRTDEEQKEH